MSRTRQDMPEIDWTRAKQVFIDVMEAPAEQRCEIVERTLRHDQRLKQVVQRLLASHEAAADFLDEPESAQCPSKRSRPR